MKVLGIKTVKRTKIILPGNWKAILARPSAAERGKSIAEVGLIHEPIVRKTDDGLVLVAGRDRMAGMELEGMDDVCVKVIECSDNEAADLEEIENIERRHDPKEIKAIVRKRVARLAAILDEEKTAGPGRPKLAKTKAIEQVAAERGVKPRSVEQAARRQRLKEEAEAAEMFGVEDEDEACIRLIGVELDEADLKDIAGVQAHIDRAASQVSAALRELGKLQHSELPIPEGPLDRLRQQVSAASSALRAMRPEVLCPFCKMIPGAVEDCAACHTKGWLGRQEDASLIPDELWEEENPRIMVAGKLKYVSEMFQGEEEEDPFA